MATLSAPNLRCPVGLEDCGPRAAMRGQIASLMASVWALGHSMDRRQVRLDVRGEAIADVRREVARVARLLSQEVIP